MNYNIAIQWVLVVLSVAYLLTLEISPAPSENKPAKICSFFYNV